MPTVKPTSVPQKLLAQEMSSSDYLFILNDVLGWDGLTPLDPALFGEVHYAAFHNANNTEIEFMQFDPAGIAAGDTTGVTVLLRGLSPDGTDLTEHPELMKPWVRNDTIVNLGADIPQILNDMASQSRGAAFQALVTFVEAHRPELTEDVDATNDKQLVARGELYRATLSGGIPADPTHLGLVKTSVTPALPTSPIAVETTDPRMLTQDENDAAGGTAGAPSSVNKFRTALDQSANTSIPNYATTVGGTADVITLAYTPAITAYTNGMKLRFKATGTNTTAVTVNVDALGAKSVVLSPATALTGTEITNGSIIDLTYDGTNFQMSVVPTGLLSGMPTILHNHEQKLIASDTLRASSNAEVISSPSGMTKIKEIRLGRMVSTVETSTVRVTFDARIPTAYLTGYYGQFRIYVNGSASGALHTIDGIDLTTHSFTDDITGLKQGDLVQLYVAPPTSGYTAAGSNFKVKYDMSIVSTFDTVIL